jgi:oligopeptide transport system permease protein
MKAQDYKISAEKFVFHSTEGNLHDTKLETKPVSYFRDAFNRFCRNKGAILAAVIIICLIMFAIFGPMMTPYTVSYQDEFYKFCQPRNSLFYDLGLGFWDGGKEGENLNEYSYIMHLATEQEIGRPVFMSEVTTNTETYMGKEIVSYSYRYDTYNEVGVKMLRLTTAQYQALQEYQDEKGVQVIYPATDPKMRPKNDNPAHLKYAQDVDKVWFRIGAKGNVLFDKEGNLVPIYLANDGTDLYTSKMLVEDGEKQYNYAVKKDGEVWEVRVDYKEYYAYKHYLAGDGITEPSFLFGANNFGKDMFTCLASGARFSFILAVIVSSVNLFIGAIYGSIEGYYGGKLDIMMERFVELLSSIPFMIVITLLKYHLNASHILILFIAFFLTGWTGMAGRTRMQFYRFKNQEYVLVARTLGAKDSRIMFKHIFPNAIGTLITSSVLVIPGVIFSETSLSYLGIINLSTGSLTSVGTLLATGQAYLYTYPHMILFPAIFISLLMLCFNLFGNGLRDAFNPSLRGSED